MSFQQIKSQKSGFRQLTAEIIDLGQKDGEIRSNLPQEILIDLFEFIFIEIVKQLALHKQDFDKQQTIENCTDLFINGVKSKQQLANQQGD